MAKKFKYQAFCIKYGTDRMLGVAFSVAAACNLSVVSAVSQTLSPETFIYSAIGGFLSASFGFLLGVGAHTLGDKIASGKRMGMRKGSKLVKTLQATGFAAGCGVLTTLNGLAAHNEFKYEITSTSNDESTSRHNTTSLTTKALRP